MQRRQHPGMAMTRRECLRDVLAGVQTTSSLAPQTCSQIDLEFRYYTPSMDEHGGVWAALLYILAPPHVMHVDVQRCSNARLACQPPIYDDSLPLLKQDPQTLANLTSQHGGLGALSTMLTAYQARQLLLYLLTMQVQVREDAQVQ